jgi:hypothetical protein
MHRFNRVSLIACPFDPDMGEESWNWQVVDMFHRPPIWGEHGGGRAGHGGSPGSTKFRTHQQQIPYMDGGYNTGVLPSICKNVFLSVTCCPSLGNSLFFRLLALTIYPQGQQDSSHNDKFGREVWRDHATIEGRAQQH